MRDRVGYGKFRFFAVGEYGDLGGRPHYHAALFGFAPCQGGYRRKGECQCSQCSIVRETWGYGHVLVGELTIKSARYITGYVAKKMTRTTDPRLRGRVPEFARMSLKPGIGAYAMDDVASDMLAQPTFGTHDVSALGYGKTSVPLGHYLTRRLRKLRGLSEKCPQEKFDELQKKVYPLRLDARSSEENPSFKARLLEASKGERLRAKARRKIYYFQVPSFLHQV